VAADKLSTQVRQEQIAGAALDLIASRGLQGFNIDRLAKSVGLVPSAIYRHFDGKEQVLRAALSMFRDRLYSLVEEARDEADGPLEALELLLVKHARLIAGHKAVPHILMCSDVAAGDESRRAKVQRIFGGYIDRVGAIVREGQRSGVIRGDVDARTIALMFAGMIQPAALLSRAKGRGFDMNAHVRRVWRLFERGVRPE